MEKTEVISKINKILESKEIENRVKPLIKLFFIGKANLEDLDANELKSQIELLVSKIKNVEFSSSEKIVTAYEKDFQVLTINKNLFTEGRVDEAILPIFMKFEEALNPNNKLNFSNHIEDFLNAGKVAIAASAPINNKLYKMYEMAKACYGDSVHKVPEFSKDALWKGVCSKYNEALNKMIITGKDDKFGILNGANLFHNEVFTTELLTDSDFEGPFKTEEFARKASKIIACIDSIEPSAYEKDNSLSEVNSLFDRIKTFTGYTKEMVNEAKTQEYNGNSEISQLLKSFFQVKQEDLTEEYIIDKVQEVLDKKDNWDSRIKFLIPAFFVRSQKIYNWNKDEFQERLNQLNIKIEEISFENLDDDYIMGKTSLDKIHLNSSVFLNKRGEFKWPVEKTLFHELGHITDESEREAIKIKESLQMPLIGQFYEWTNTIFERLSVGEKFYKKNNSMQLAHAGYQALAPLGSMVACAMGISEVEFANIKDKGLDYENELLAQMFSQTASENGETKNNEALEIIEKIKDIFNSYELDSSFSISKKTKNQSLANDIYSECLKLMNIRIEKDLQSGKIENMEEYKKYQSFYLKKMNFNFAHATRSDGFIFSRAPITHDIGFCNDKLSKADLLKINEENVKRTEFGFDKESLAKYKRSLTVPTKRENIFDKRIKVNSDLVNEVALKGRETNEQLELKIGEQETPENRE